MSKNVISSNVGVESNPTTVGTGNGRGPQPDPADPQAGTQEYHVEKSTPLTKDEVERRLDSTKESISLRLDALQEEFANTGAGIAKTVSEKPLVGVALAAAAGVAIGFLFGGFGSKRRRRGQAVEAASQEIAASVRDLLESGATPEDAVQQAVGEARSALGQAVDLEGSKRGIVARSLLPLLAAGANLAFRQGIRHVAQQLDSKSEQASEDANSEPGA